MESFWDKQGLQQFEIRVAEAFNSGLIKTPVHLSDGNETALLEIFKKIKEGDWIFCSWRSHYHCLLKGVPPEDVFAEILAGNSIALNFPEHRVFSSAIVGGQVPIAVGVALAEKTRNSRAHTWCFIGDMTSETGIVQTSIRYSETNDLPITFVIEDNNISVRTDTRGVWKKSTLRYEEHASNKVIAYKYTSKYPHAGAGVRVQF